MATKKNLTALNKILQSGALKDALAISQKYTPEDSVYKADQTRINDAISNLTRERFPEFEKARMSASGQFLANESKRNQWVECKTHLVNLNLSRPLISLSKK